MNLFHLLRPVVVLLAIVGSVIFSTRASGVERKYSLRGTALLDNDGIVVGAGNATHLGNYTEDGFASISGNDLTALQLEGYVTLTAANGDKLREHITGHLNFFTGAITATVTFIGGEGRFEDASGSAILLGQVGPSGISVVVVGTIDF